MFRVREFRIFADPRHGQMLALGTLITFGSVWLSFEMPWWRPLTALMTALLVQWLAARLLSARFDWRSAAITAGSLTLLLRTDGPELVALAAALAIASKSLLRIDNRHFLNPAAFGIAVVVLSFEGAWVSPGQWGVGGMVLPIAVAAGLSVTYGARRLEVPVAFLAFWSLLVFGRAAWLGDPVAVPLHQMSSGMIVVFAFFMISDPMTAPWHPLARLGWVALVALTGFLLQITWVVDAGPLFGLVVCAPLVPLLNRIFPAPSASWRAPSPSKGARTCVVS